MANKTDDENSKPFEFRPGSGMPGYRGMYRRGDPALIPPNQFHALLNVRLGEGDVRSRPGMTHVEGELEADACITGIFEIEDVGVAVLITQYGHEETDPDTGSPLLSTYQILAFNEERDPPDLNYWDEDALGSKAAPIPWRREAASEGRPFHTFRYWNGRLLMLSGAGVYEITFSEEETPRMDVALLFSAEDLIDDYICSMCTRRERVDDPQTGDEFERDVLYLGCSAGEIIRYDGNAVELVHTLADASPAHIISFWGSGLVAAGDDGFSWQDQAYAWEDETWGVTDFKCNGLCEWGGEVVFVGDTFDQVFSGKWAAYALHWDGSAGSPTTFVSDEPGSPTGIDHRARSPVVAGGALHWLRYNVEGDDPVSAGAEVYIPRYVDFTTGSLTWEQLADIDGTGDPDNPEIGFFIGFAGGILLLVPNAGNPTKWSAGVNIVLYASGDSPQSQEIYNYPFVSGENPFTGIGWEAVSI